MKNSRPFFFVLFLLACVAVSATAKTSKRDSLLLEKIYSFQRNYAHEVNGFATNVYIKHLYQTHKRNVTLWAIPSTYAIAKGDRQFVSEQYSRLYFRSVSDFDHVHQVYYTTIPSNRRTLPVLSEFITPDLYDVTMYGDHILSPFCSENRIYYKYSSVDIGHGQIRLYFRPRIMPNTQLVKGKAIVNRATGQIEQLEMEGEYDMIRFRTLTMQGDHGARALLPRLCRTSIEFKFAGNHITSEFTALFDCPITLPDSVSISGNRELIDSLRPISLSREEEYVYHIYDSLHKKRPDTTVVDTTSMNYEKFSGLMKQELEPYQKTDQKPKPSTAKVLRDIGWDIGSNLIRSLRIGSENLSLKLSPLLNPQYLSYSSSKGISYKLRLNGEYRFNEGTRLRLRPQVGRHFNRNEWYYDLPFWFHYNPKHDNTLYFSINKGNRIGNANVMDDIIKVMPATDEDLSDRKWHYFGDNSVHLLHSMYLSRQLKFTAGLTYHYRKALHADKLDELGLTSLYQSLAPSISLKWRPWPNAPVLSIDYERAMKTKHMNVDYERWESDISSKFAMSHLQTLNLRVGFGIYTRRDGNNFMDFANFRDNNLPEGWDDDWTGEFQLLDSRLYNDSRYYVRGNISYESPLLGVSMVPLFGRYVERERAYWNMLNIQNVSLYSELGYGFTTRYFSMGVFASFRNMTYQDITTKFTFELFSRW